MAYISVKEAAEKWAINETLVRRYCRQGRIPRAKQIDGSWMIPENAKKPSKVEVVSKPKELPPLAKKLKNQKKKKNYHGLYDHVQINLTYSSSRMASNRLTRDQVETLFRKCKVRVSFEPMKASDINEVINHFVCVDYVLEHVMDQLSQKLIQQLHYMLMFGTVDHRKSRVNPGAYRKDNTPRSLPSMPKAEDIAACLSQLITEYEKLGEIGMKEILDFHVRFEEIVPFEDGNGRIARLIVNFILLRHNYPMVVVLSRKKTAYLNALGLADVNVGVVPADGSHASIEQIKPFVKYMTDLMVSEINQNIALLHADAKTTWWYDGETVTFRSPRTVLLLQHLQKNPKATIAELASVLDINTSAVQKQLSNLLAKGYITKDPDTNSYRVIAVSTTK